MLYYHNMLFFSSTFYPRTEDASAQGAKSYTREARNRAYLEGKVSKLTAILDHYRYDFIHTFIHTFFF